MNTRLQLVFFVLIGLVILVDAFWIMKTEKRLKRFFMGKKGKDLEDLMVKLEEDIKVLQDTKANVEQELAVINQKLQKSVRGLEVVRFNPFPDQGSNQSFAIGMLDEKGDGVVISSLYSRERMSVFAKPIKEGKSEYELSNEESEVVERAKIK